MATSTLPEPDDMGRLVSSAIRTQRLALGLTMQQVAQVPGLSHPVLCEVERGLAGLSLASLDRIVEFAGGSSALPPFHDAHCNDQARLLIVQVDEDDEMVASPQPGRVIIRLIGAGR